MRVVIGHSAKSNLRSLRQAVLGAGANCGAEDCVSFAALAARISQERPDVVVIDAETADDADWTAVAQLTQSSQAPTVAVGRKTAELVQKARQAGVAQFVGGDSIARQLPGILDQLCGGRGRGRVIVSFAPKEGSGGSTVAVHVAGAMAGQYPGQVALVELVREGGDVALLTGVKPVHTAEEACQRWQSLDVSSLPAVFTAQPTGLHVLANGNQTGANEHLSADAVRRLAVVCRAVYPYTVFAISSTLRDEEMELMHLADIVLLVVRPDVPSARQAHTALEKLATNSLPPERIRLVLNRYGQRGQLSQKKVETLLKLKALACIPDDPGRVNKAKNEGLLLPQVSRLCTITRRFAGLAKALNGSAKKA